MNRAGCPVRILEVVIQRKSVGFRWLQDEHPPVTLEVPCRFDDPRDYPAFAARLQSVPAFQAIPRGPECWLLYREEGVDSPPPVEGKRLLDAIQAVMRGVVDRQICLHACEKARLDVAVRNIHLANAMCCTLAGRSNVAFAVELSTFTSLQRIYAAGLIEELRVLDQLVVTDEEPLPLDRQVIVTFAENDRPWQAIVRRRAEGKEYEGRWPILVTCESHLAGGIRSGTVAEICDYLLAQGAVTVSAFNCRPHVPNFPLVGRGLGLAAQVSLKKDIPLNPDELLEKALNFARRNWRP